VTAAGIDAATPAHRDRTIDALRALAILGVVLGHWLVSALVSDPYQRYAWHGESPLSYERGWIPATWLLQTLGPFFFAGGYAAARGLRTRRYRPWLAGRVSRLIRPVLALAAVWLPAMLLLRAVGAPASTRHVIWSLVTHPLWFLLVYLALTALTPILRAAVHRFGVWSALPLIGLTAVAAVPIGWAVPFLLGIGLAENALPRRAGAVLLPLGVVTGAALVWLAGYPASAVGVPGDARSNLDPPSLFALALAAAQIGAFLLARPRLARILRRPAVWAPVAALNLTAMTVYCWHQTALLLVTFAGLATGAPPGLLDPPAGDWPLHRLGWLPVFAATLALLCAAFHRFERTRVHLPDDPAPETHPGNDARGIRPSLASAHRPKGTS
jgi:hypothetical protein